MRPWAPAGRAVPVLQASLCVSGPGTSGTPRQRSRKVFRRAFFQKGRSSAPCLSPPRRHIVAPAARPVVAADAFSHLSRAPAADLPRRSGAGKLFARPFFKKAVCPPQQGPASATFRRVRRHHGQGRGACFQAAGVLGRKGLACQARKSPQGVVSLRAVWFADQYIFSYFFTISSRRIPSARLADSQTLATEVGLLMKCRMTYMSPPFVAAT